MADTSLPPPLLNSNKICDPNTGNATPSFRDWLVRLFNRSGGTSTDLAPAAGRYIIADADPRLPNAQILNELDNGFIKNIGGVLSSTSDLKITSNDLDDTGVVAGTYGSTTLSTTIIVGEDGRISNISENSIDASKILGTTLGDTSPTDANILIADGTQWNSKSISNDVHIDDTGSATIQPNAVEYSMLAQDAGNGIVNYSNGSGSGTATQFTFTTGRDTNASYPEISTNSTFTEFSNTNGAFKFHNTSNGNSFVWQFSGSISFATFSINDLCTGNWKFGGQQTWTFPIDLPTSGNQFLTCDGSGNMTFSNVVASQSSDTYAYTFAGGV